MNKKQIAMGVILIFIMLINSGCALINVALNAGIAYGLYELTK